MFAPSNQLLRSRSRPKALDAAPRSEPGLQRLAWPAPALLSWLLAWTGWALVRTLLSPWVSGPAWAMAGLPLLAGAAVGAALAWRWPLASGLRRFIVAAGFPLSAAGSGLAQGVPAWAWLMPLALLLLAYPLRAWRDAPFFPTPMRALDGLSAMLSLPAGAKVLDAGCGLGHGLRALRRCWPDARLHGVEWSGLLAMLARLRCPYAKVQQGDMWGQDWMDYSVVYLFQRPESMAGAWAKAKAQMAPGSWLISLDFEVPNERASARLHTAGAQPLWLYQVPEAVQVGRDSIPGRTGR